jgi:AraC-like DNA-binding protein
MDVGHHLTLVRQASPPALGGLVAGMVGMSERATDEVRRRQPAGTLLPLVFTFGGSLEIDALSDASGAGEYRSFVAGLSTGYASTRFHRTLDSVHVYLTPLGVRRILGVPGKELARLVVATGDLVREWETDLSDRLDSARGWGERFALVESALLQQLARHPAPPMWVAWMWRQIHGSGGQARIADLVAGTGWSHRHVATVFAEQVGLTPKQAAGVVRFEHAAADLGRLPLAEVAARHGYADQSHLSRAVARYAGETPSELIAARRPTPSTAMGRR